MNADAPPLVVPEPVQKKRPAVASHVDEETLRSVVPPPAGGGGGADHDGGCPCCQPSRPPPATAGAAGETKVEAAAGRGGDGGGGGGGGVDDYPTIDAIKDAMVEAIRTRGEGGGAGQGGGVLSPFGADAPVRLGIITVSDRASCDAYEDRGGPAILRFFYEAVETPWQAFYSVVPDDQARIEEAMRQMADELKCSVIVSTGGTGPAPRDVTPDATLAVCDRILPGFGEQMRAISLRVVKTAVLSRQEVGTRGKSVIINLPGSPRSIRQIIDHVFLALTSCVVLLGGPRIAFREAVCGTNKQG